MANEIIAFISQCSQYHQVTTIVLKSLKDIDRSDNVQILGAVVISVANEIIAIISQCSQYRHVKLLQQY